MIKEFTYPLPDELYVDGVSGENVGTYTYDGPEKFDVQVSREGYVVNIDINSDPPLGPNYRKTIDAKKQVELAYLFNHYFIEDYKWDYEYEDEIMENGDVYKKIINPDLINAYEPIFNFETNEWEIRQIIKEQTNPLRDQANSKKNFVEQYSREYSFGAEIDKLIADYISQIDKFIEDNPPLKSWKYTNFNFVNIPKIPATLAIEFSKLPAGGDNF